MTHINFNRPEPAPKNTVTVIQLSEPQKCPDCMLLTSALHRGRYDWACKFCVHAEEVTDTTWLAQQVKFVIVGSMPGDDRSWAEFAVKRSCTAFFSMLLRSIGQIERLLRREPVNPRHRAIMEEGRNEIRLLLNHATRRAADPLPSSGADN